MARRFNLSEMAGRTPPLDPAQAAQAVKSNLYTALLGRIGAEDVEQMADGIVKRAKEGNQKAIDTVLKLIGDAGTPPKVVERVVEVEKEVIVERPVVIAGVQEGQLRKLVALSIHVNGSLMKPAIAQLTGLPEDKAEALVSHEWFVKSSKGYSLSATGRQAVG